MVFLIKEALVLLFQQPWKAMYPWQWAPNHAGTEVCLVGSRAWWSRGARSRTSRLRAGPSS